MAQTSQHGEQHVPNPSGFGKEKVNERKPPKTIAFFVPNFAATDCRVS
jgi:hypothetical protein